MNKQKKTRTRKKTPIAAAFIKDLRKTYHLVQQSVIEWSGIEKSAYIKREKNMVAMYADEFLCILTLYIKLYGKREVFSRLAEVFDHLDKEHNTRGCGTESNTK